MNHTFLFVEGKGPSRYVEQKLRCVDGSYTAKKSKDLGAVDLLGSDVDGIE